METQNLLEFASNGIQVLSVMCISARLESWGLEEEEFPDFFFQSRNKDINK